MNLELSIMDIYRELSGRKNFKSKDQLLDELIYTFNTTDILVNYLSDETKGFERNDCFGKTNPLLWEYGHTLFFWEQMTLKYMGITSNIAKPELYDSFRVDRETRFELKNKLLSYNEIQKGYNSVIEHIYDYLNKYKLNNITFYLIRLGQLHLEMHNESFIFTQQLLGVRLFPISNLNYEEPILYNVEMINVLPGIFSQGASNFTSEFYFDNEFPSFTTSIMKCKISKYCITNYQYLQFVLDGGYTKQKYWLPEGWRWIRKNKLKHPIYWKSINNIWFERIFGGYVSLRNNNPVVHISWYEAKAYCEWKGVRLLKESEWEYIAKMFPLNKYIKNAHLNYSKQTKTRSTISVLEDKNENNLGIMGLFGNCWEWCEEPIYPYNGFIIDPVYREMSYPWFGHKRICRGGCWAVPNILITPTYRNAQAPDCTYQYIGFRVAI